MRVLHVLHTYPPDSSGGTETYVQALAAAQRAAGDEPLILAGSDARPDGPLAREPLGGISVLRRAAPPRNLERLEGLDGAARRALEEVLDAERPDLVHVHHWHNQSADAVATCAARGLPTVATLHDYFTSCPFFFRLPDHEHPCPPELSRATCVACVGRIAGEGAEVIDAAFARREAHFRGELARAGAVLVLSEFQRGFLERYPPFSGLPLRCLPLPAPELPAVPPAPPAPRSAGGPLRVVSWGGLERGKGLATLVEAAASLPRGTVTLDHFGRVLDEAFGRELLAAAGSVPLTLHGAFERESTLPGLARFDLAVFPSLYLETHGYAVDEALALGLPVVVSDRGAPRERIGGRGRVVPAGDAGRLAELLGELAAHPEELARLRAAVPPHAPTLAEHARALRALYRELAARSGR